MGLFESIRNTFSKSEPAAAAEPPSAEGPESAEAAESAEVEATRGEARTYTVLSGDTLWKIAERVYGNGSQYMKIFEANTDLLESPDRIFPGQELKIPE